MAKKYSLNIKTSDNNTTPIEFTLPSSQGSYEFKLNLSNGKVITAGLIKVNPNVNTYKLILTLSNGSSIDCGTFSTEAVSALMAYFVGGNWKMNLTEANIEGYVNGLNFTNSNTTIVLFPQACLIKPLHDALVARGAINGNTIKLGAQLCSPHASGAFSGQNSVAALMSVGAEYFMIGNDEVEVYAEKVGDNVDYSGQLEQVLTNGGKVLFYINESLDIYEANGFESYLVERLQILQNFANLYADKITLVYVPAWTIGTGKTISIDQIRTRMITIKSKVESLLSIDTREAMQYVYGGTSNPNNVTDILGVMNTVFTVETVGTVPGGVALKTAQFNTYLNAIGEM